MKGSANSRAGFQRATAAAPALRVLCAEDSSPIGQMLLALLARAGHLARHAHNGRDAWEILTSGTPFDVVVTDHQMPGVGGAELVRLLRQSNFAGRIVVYSSSLSEEERARYEWLGVDAIVEKSSRPNALMAAIEGR